MVLLAAMSANAVAKFVVDGLFLTFLEVLSTLALEPPMCAQVGYGELEAAEFLPHMQNVSDWVNTTAGTSGQGTVPKRLA